MIENVSFNRKNLIQRGGRYDFLNSQNILSLDRKRIYKFVGKTTDMKELNVTLD